MTAASKQSISPNKSEAVAAGCLNPPISDGGDGIARDVTVVCYRLETA